MRHNLAENKRNAQSFYDLMFNQCKPREAIEKFAGDDYIQHNPHVADGKEAFIDYFEEMAAFPKSGHTNGVNQWNLTVGYRPEVATKTILALKKYSKSR